MQVSDKMDRRQFVAGALAAAAAGVAGADGAMAAEKAADSAAADTAAAEVVDTFPRIEGGSTVELHRAYGAAHGDKCFTQAVVAVSDGVIVAANVDDYQFMDNTDGGVVAVPNTDRGLSDNYAVPTTQLASKTDNNERYSANMAGHGGATLPWLDSIRAIEAFAVGQTPADLADIAQQGMDGTIAVADTIAGATLADSFGYLSAIAAAATDETNVATGTFDGDPSTLSLGRGNFAAHGTKGFTSAVTLMQGDTIVATNLDDFQFADPTAEGVVGLPNSDAAFGENYAEGKVLCSKSQIDEYYSSNMASKAGATQHWLTSIQAIQSALADLNASYVPGVNVDTISGSTLADTSGYAAAAGIAGLKA